MIAIDTSVVVAALLGAHERHPECLAALREALSQPPVVVPGPVLLESFSVLTRLPAPLRVAPAAALAMLVSAFQGRALAPELVPAGSWSLLKSAVVAGISGGTIHDAHIAACAREAGATRLMTLNPRHFALVAPDLALVVPQP